MKTYSVYFQAIEYTDYSKVYAKIVKHWLECGGNRNQESGMFVGDESVVACFHLTFIDDNLIVTFSEIKAHEKI